MLILNTQQVNYCNVIRQGERRIEHLPGVIYRGKLFVKGESYSKNQREDAISRARRELLLCLIIEEPTGFTLWYQDENVKLADEPNLKRRPSKTEGNSASNTNFISTLDLNKLVAQMRNVGGITISNRRYRLTVYPKCFVGSEAVVWFMNNLKISQEEAVYLGQRLIDEQWIHHVTDEHSFKDEYLFYRFYWDE